MKNSATFGYDHFGLVDSHSNYAAYGNIERNSFAEIEREVKNGYGHNMELK